MTLFSRISTYRHVLSEVCPSQCLPCTKRLILPTYLRSSRPWKNGFVTTVPLASTFPMGLVCEKKFKTSKFIRQISNLPNELYVDLMSSSSSLEVKASGEKTPSNMIIEAKRLKSDKLFKIADDSLKSSNKVGKKCINVETENQLESAMCDEKHSPEISGGGNEKIIIGFTCKQCSTRTHHKMSKNAYKRGVVLIECPGCSNRHLIADNLGWFSDSPGVSVNVETMSTSQGVQVARKADSHCDKIAIEKLLSDLDEVDQ